MNKKYREQTVHWYITTPRGIVLGGPYLEDKMEYELLIWKRTNPKKDFKVIARHLKRWVTPWVPLNEKD